MNSSNLSLLARRDQYNIDDFSDEPNFNIINITNETHSLAEVCTLMTNESL